MEEKNRTYTREDWIYSALSVRLLLIGWVVLALVTGVGELLAGTLTRQASISPAVLLIASFGSLALNLAVGARQKRYSAYFTKMMLAALISCACAVCARFIPNLIASKVFLVIQFVASIALCICLRRGFDAQLALIPHSTAPRVLGSKMTHWVMTLYGIMIVAEALETLFSLESISESLLLWILFLLLMLALAIAGIGALIYQFRFMMNTGRYFKLQARRTK